MRYLFGLVLAALTIVSANAQSVGDRINLNGAGPRLLTMNYLKTLQFSRLGWSQPTVATMGSLKNWTSAGIGGWAPYKDSSSDATAPQFNSLTGNWEIEAYPNQNMMSDLGITDLYSVDADGAFVIQPRLLKPAEQDAINLTISRLDAGNQGSIPALRNIRWLSGLVTTQPSGISPPFVIGARVQLPFPCQQGYWPAVWLMNANGGWPPETDILENVCRKDLGFQLTAHMHSGKTATLDATAQVPWNANAAGYHDYWAVVYNDKTLIAYDGVVVAVFPTPPDWVNQPAYMIINYALAGQNNGWPGPLDPSITSVPPMKVVDVIAAQMPSTYGGGPVMTYVPPSGAQGIVWGSTTPLPPPPPPAPVQSISVTSAIPATVSGMFPVSGKGAGNLNVAVFTADWATKLSADAKPSATGAWSTSIDTSKLPAGQATAVIVAGFATAAGTPGAFVTAPLTLTRAAAPPPPAPGPTAAQQAALDAVTAALATLKAALGAK